MKAPPAVCAVQRQIKGQTRRREYDELRSCAHGGRASASLAVYPAVLRLQLLRRSVYPHGRFSPALAVPDGGNIELKERSPRDS